MECEDRLENLLDKTSDQDNLPAYLKHGKQQVLFSTLILVAVNGEHDCLEELVDLGHGDEAT